MARATRSEIPTEFVVIENKGEKGQKKEIVNLQKKDMPKVATFESEYHKLRVILEPKKGIKDEDTKQWEEVANTAVRLRFEDGKCRIENKRLLKMVMSCGAYQRGLFTIDREDPTGFWRELNAIQVKTVPVVIQTEITTPNFDDLDLEKLTPLKQGDNLEPIRVIRG